MVARRSASRADLRLGQAHQRATRGLSEEHLIQKRARVLCLVAEHLAAFEGLAPTAIASSRLSEVAWGETARSNYPKSASAWREALGSELCESVEEFCREATKDDRGTHLSHAHHLGHTLDLLLSAEVTIERRKLGSYYTPVGVARSLMERAVLALKERGASVRSVCDPACGGGAFLLEAAQALCTHSDLLGDHETVGLKEPVNARERAVRCLYGVDLSVLAVGVTELAAWLFVGDPSVPVRRVDQFVVGDALVDQDGGQSVVPPAELQTEGIVPFSFSKAFPAVFARGNGFDWVVGNPPWVAFQGRATQKISVSLRSYFRRRYTAFSGYPTLHALFLQRVCELAPSGVITLLLPSSLSDLDGYRAVRSALRQDHEPVEPLEEYGQDAFLGVVQPCFGLLAFPRKEGLENCPSSKERPFILNERQKENAAFTVPAPQCLAAFDDMPSLPKEVFGEMGFQSNTRVVQALFFRGDDPHGSFELPLLEGRNVGEFCQRSPRLFMRVDQQLLRETRCRLRPSEAYRAVDFVVRQTAPFTIAAMHNGLAFRNSLIAGFRTSAWDAPVLVALLNSALFRALHCCRQRDARQAAFPQVKVSHLRRLPAPPVAREEQLQKLSALTRTAESLGGLDEDARLLLDGLVFDLFEVSPSDRKLVLDYLRAVAPKALRPSR